ncbi:type IV pilus modification protein PilV [Stenotrophomonas sp. SY1]|uniref:type IV pilus modification protein PilV n=1 Tax=Stenotrophomonas sp. SY1 TaxID=477235 RepID=UPI001E382362|nr:type IV pilus modification protein PilV [Stenotrophomonas sp. SY1]MCD9086514.1 type IV pilus modification protein PilV [Stenotrophomonas sp. SY1]
MMILKKRGRARERSLPGRMRGVSLLEVLISVLILGIGLLGIAAMQALALRGGQSSLESSQAVMQTSSIAESMRANRANAAAYAMGMTCAASGGGSLAENDLAAWLDSLKDTMGVEDDSTTCGRIEALGNSRYRITVQWDDSRSGGGAQRQVITEVSI